MLNINDETEKIVGNLPDDNYARSELAPIMGPVPIGLIFYSFLWPIEWKWLSLYHPKWLLTSLWYIPSTISSKIMRDKSFRISCDKFRWCVRYTKSTQIYFIKFAISIYNNGYYFAILILLNDSCDYYFIYYIFLVYQCLLCNRYYRYY